MSKKQEKLTQEEIWDDSALIDSWNEALQEYKKYHSIHAKGGSVRELETQNQAEAEAESGSEQPQVTETEEIELESGTAEQNKVRRSHHRAMSLRSQSRLKGLPHFLYKPS
ncbi:hypothetical protein FVEG_11272 [Fusarium verticillioides 7600]|uniref:Survival Motor Neuron Gemin2-binding domain-containing protein n=1 Tax=Gibberella moniliformis (strain M3125 / FGSC 7600) TaxID=334819 RepID=W7MM37_GIBM7|nr:hypothetical protein FVEG_11272 [Fusarium verticillioides 7600]EWG52543.1 hypothetical protein FVEG_11272 [Fusarium verticillioides 7600]